MRNQLLSIFTMSVLAVASLTASTLSVAQSNQPANTPMANDAKNTVLRQDLLTLIKAGQAIEAETKPKQLELEKKYQPQVAQAKTDEQKQALQTQFLTDVVAFKTSQKQQLLALSFTEPRVANLRNKVVATLDSDIAAAQVVINNPIPTADSQKKFTAAINQSKTLTKETHDSFASLMTEAGLNKNSLTPKK